MITVEVTASVLYTCELTAEDEEKVKAFAEENDVELASAVWELYSVGKSIYTRTPLKAISVPKELMTHTRSELAYANSPGRFVHTAQHTRRGHEKICAYCHIDKWRNI